MTALLAGAVTLVATPAAAASTPRCNSTLQVGSLRVPAYRSSTLNTVFCVMPVGTTGAAVRQLQTSLNICYGQRLQVDGSYGWKTFNAVAAAQRAERMADVDGVYGPDTAVSIKHQNIHSPGASWCGYQ
ncbi:peptidoglycan-binding domain-containing protein [Catellatospora methionotrophica]|uniref:peptidoglycan-binding domain-containing protein n=1 Tax=Catellatospora methionotrophica TaxID=121620 RepID=UPI0033C21E9C